MMKEEKSRSLTPAAEGEATEARPAQTAAG
jgi:hypothetical protein